MITGPAPVQSLFDVIRRLRLRDLRSRDKTFPGANSRVGRHRDSDTVRSVQYDEAAFGAGDAGRRLRLRRGNMICH